MGNKVWITGLTCILALVPFLEALGLQASKDIIIVGAILAVIGCVLIILDR